ncbi:MAG: branched-chain amino acid ABC transporter substrate-binding protein [Alphaproteobacteria bacterium]|nr:MAG: branched-chain amino acid ABC transporter substrate-binding protein [Alphaproteobacteria bacterium]
MKKYILAAILSFILSAQAHADITIGVSLPMTGSAASLGEQSIAGIKAAIEDINAAGGVLGQKLVYKLEDDACDPKQAVLAANRLVSAAPAVIIGPGCSGPFMAASDVTAEEGIAHITPTASNPEITERGMKNVFRPYGRDDQQGLVLAEYIGKNYAKERIAIIHDKSTWGKGLADATRDNLRKAGVREALYDTITVGEKDFSSLVTKLKAKGITVVLLATFPVEGGSIVRQAADLKLNIKFIGGDSALVQEFWSVANKAANGFVMSGPLDPTKDKASASVIKSLQARKIKPEIFTLYAYADVQLAADAIAKAGSTDSLKITEALRSNSFQTVLGKIEFNDKGDLKIPMFKMYQWKNGKYDYLAGAM